MSLSRRPGNARAPWSCVMRVRILRDAKPRTAVASRHGQWRGGASREGGEPPRAVAADHRALPQSRAMAMPRNGNIAWARARNETARTGCTVRTATWHGGNQAYRRKQEDKLEGKFCLKGKDQFGRIAPTNAPERCLSGLRCLTRNQVYRKVPGVRIPLSPPFFLRVFRLSGEVKILSFAEVVCTKDFATFRAVC